MPTDDDDDVLNELDVLCEGNDGMSDNFLPVLKEKLERIPPGAIDIDRQTHFICYYIEIGMVSV
jgi:hypothetical protein